MQVYFQYQQIDFIIIITGRLILIMGRTFTGILQMIRYRPSLNWNMIFGIFVCARVYVYIHTHTHTQRFKSLGSVQFYERLHFFIKTTVTHIAKYYYNLK